MMVQIKNLGKIFPNQKEVLKDLNLQIENQEFVALLGPSGCGKSTLLKIIAGLDVITSGTLNVEASPSQRGFVFQDPHLMPWRTVFENASLALELSGMDPSLIQSKVSQALHLVGLSDSVNEYPHELSGGMKMRVSIARALALEPKLLLMDEPFAALDEINRFYLAEELREISQSLKITIVFVTHSLLEATFLSDRACIIGGFPAKIQKEVSILLPKIRTESLRTSPEFAAEFKKVHSAFHESYPSQSVLKDLKQQLSSTRV